MRGHGGEFRKKRCSRAAFGGTDRSLRGYERLAGAFRPVGLMDRQTKHEIWILAIGTIMIEAPFLAVAALAWAGH
jgi:hypothetical protein